MKTYQLPAITHRHIDIDGLKIFYRETGPADAPTLLLLHGFPSASHQFRRLFDVLGNDFHLIAPDYPGFGHSDAPASVRDGGSVPYSFDFLADVMEKFCRALALDAFSLYLFDFGAPVGFRLAARHPEWIRGLIIQNGNAYEEGLSEMAKSLISLRPNHPDADAKVAELLTLPVTQMQYLGGTSNAALVAPEGWTLDQHFLDQPGRKAIQTDLMFDYHRNVEQYPAWQTWLSRHQPPALILWGRNDVFFPEAGAHAYLRDLPNAERHLFDTGHFALEEKLPELVPHIARFLEQRRAAP